jgi:hypothetical protein
VTAFQSIQKHIEVIETLRHMHMEKGDNLQLHCMEMEALDIAEGEGAVSGEEIDDEEDL